MAGRLPLKQVVKVRVLLSELRKSDPGQLLSACDAWL